MKITLTKEEQETILRAYIEDSYDLKVTKIYFRMEDSEPEVDFVCVRTDLEEGDY
jgi:hypothetical protein